MTPSRACFSSTRLTWKQETSKAQAHSLLLMMTATLMMLRCVVRRLVSPHPAVCRDRWTPLMYVTDLGGREGTVHLLLEYKADVRARDG
jgi:hypothetical protein